MKLKTLMEVLVLAKAASDSLSVSHGPSTTLARLAEDVRRLSDEDLVRAHYAVHELKALLDGLGEEEVLLTGIDRGGLLS